MSDSKPNVSKMPEKKEMPEKKSRIPLGPRRLVGYGYLVIFVFFAVFFLFLAEARKVNPGLDTPRWSLLLAGLGPSALPARVQVCRPVHKVSEDLGIRSVLCAGRHRRLSSHCAG